jgi:aerobic-type carbon monoxide dehydrogenase small subunit (CoxS/CutS family)
MTESNFGTQLRQTRLISRSDLCILFVFIMLQVWRQIKVTISSAFPRTFSLFSSYAPVCFFYVSASSLLSRSSTPFCVPSFVSFIVYFLCICSLPFPLLLTCTVKSCIVVPTEEEQMTETFHLTCRIAGYVRILEAVLQELASNNDNR